MCDEQERESIERRIAEGGPSGSRSESGAAAGGELEVAPGVRVRSDAITWSFTSSGGPGGQNVNKRATKAELRIAVGDLGLRPAAQGRLAQIAGRRVSTSGELVISCDANRSQERNKSECLDRLRDLLLEAIPEPRIRRPTRPSRGSKLRRMESKRRSSDIKKGRQRPGQD